ncbi:hypothetical protein [Acinetobacter variabilis]|uniref:hypothetical protein n=1 Tax=Acinetobacter variabilis TaxID=70346 RepID=UPI00403DE47B
MKKDLTDLIEGLLIYLELTSIHELRSLSINEDLIRKVANFLSGTDEKITIGKIAELLDINRASIYNTYPKTLEYIKGLIILQKNKNNQRKAIKSKNSVKKPLPKTDTFRELNQEKIERFMSIIMSLEYQKQSQAKQINLLKSTIASLNSEILEYKKMLGHY